MKIYQILKIAFVSVLVSIFIGCKNEYKQPVNETNISVLDHALLVEKPDSIVTPEGMVWVEGKTLTQGAKPNDQMAMPHEKPGHQVAVDGFFMDMTEITNAQFKAFVDATRYITVAERPIDWEMMKKELPEGSQKPADSVLQPGSLIFNKNLKKVADMDNYTQWWTWKIGANWKHPEGPESTIENRSNYPVVHIAYEDALAYCEWKNRRIPSEAEWESAAQGSNQNTIFTWGNDRKYLDKNANTWQGVFPIKNVSNDGFELIAPVKSYPSNSIGIYDMLGNVWEITNDLYNVNYYKELDPSKTQINPMGAEKGYSPANVYQQEHVIKGGSFLCNASYCASFRISARMGMSPDSGSDHAGFRTVTSAEGLQKK